MKFLIETLIVTGLLLGWVSAVPDLDAQESPQVEDETDDSTQSMQDGINSDADGQRDAESSPVRAGEQGDQSAESEDDTEKDEPLPEILQELRKLSQKLETEDVRENKRLICDWKTNECTPDGLDINGGQASTVVITGLPREKDIQVTARTGFVYKKDVRERVLKTQSAEYLTWQRKIIDGRDVDIVSVDLHLKRAKNDYGKAEVFLKRRKDTPAALAIVVDAGDSAEVFINVRTLQETKTFAIPLRYRRWFLDAGGGLLFTDLVDEELELRPVNGDPSMVEVVGKRDSDSLGTDTAVMMHFVPANYRATAFALGVGTDSGRSPSFYLGFGWRARQLGKRALATISLGVAAVELKDFRDVKVGEMLPATSSLLEGSERYKFGGFLGVTLGFTFGGGPAGSTGSSAGSLQDEEE